MQASSIRIADCYAPAVADPLNTDVEYLPIDNLRLDWSNPRFPSEQHERDRSQSDLIRLMDRYYNPLAVARSIAQHGYFNSEPLIAIAEGSTYRVLEGNRRLAALKILRDADLRTQLAVSNTGWRRIAVTDPPSTVPVLVVQNEEDVDALLGFRHISGIEPWSPFQQAQFIAKLVDDRGLSLEAVADVVGRPLTEVRSMYRDFDVLRLGRKLGINVKPARDRFGTFTAAMGRPALRSMIGAPAPRDVDPDYQPFDPDRVAVLNELLGFIFGTADESRVISDSRQIRDLVAIIEDESGISLRVLRETRDLNEALSALGQPDVQVARAIALANSHLRRASDFVRSPLSAESQRELQETRRLAEQLLTEHGK